MRSLKEMENVLPLLDKALKAGDIKKVEECLNDLNTKLSSFKKAKEIVHKWTRRTWLDF